MNPCTNWSKVIFALTLSFFACTFAARAQSPQQETIIGSPDISEKQVTAVRDAFEEMPGVQVVSYLEPHQVFLLRYDPLLYPEATAIVTRIEEQYPKLRWLLKTGATHRELLSISSGSK